MTEQVMDIGALPEFINNTFGASKVIVHATNNSLIIEPIKEIKTGCCSRVRGMLADCPEMSVDKFLERKRKDKELDL
ncbi:MAG: hypothetical protein LBS60_12370 [Deltaproteobacteria bacterium]|nr:hypothetical protein [Deltaproteobacteria bacterium]